MKGNNVMKERLVVANVLIGGQLSKMDILASGDILMKVNDKKVNNLSDFRKYFVQTNKKCIKIETSKNKIAILPIDKLKKDDKLMRKNFNYSESKLFKQFK
jgi:PDZ domain-containing secreted protein